MDLNGSCIRDVTLYVQPRFRKKYDAERLLATLPRLDGFVRPAVDVAQLEACLRAWPPRDSWNALVSFHGPSTPEPSSSSPSRGGEPRGRRPSRQTDDRGAVALSVQCLSQFFNASW